MYATAGCDSCYLNIFVGNGYRNRGGIPFLDSYTTPFRKLRGAFDRKTNENLVARSSITILMAATVSHTTLQTPRSEWRLIVPNNFHTQHMLAEQIRIFTDNKFSSIETIWLNNLDAKYRQHVKEAIERFEKVPRRAWLLCKIFHHAPGPRAQRVIKVTERA